MATVSSNNTYWNAKGKYQEIQLSLAKLVPSSGAVAKDSPKLEEFRKASNCYYDLYNNGLCNRRQEFRRVFGFSGRQAGESLDGWLATNLNRVEDRMNEIILAAAKEQEIPCVTREQLLDALRNISEHAGRLQNVEFHRARIYEICSGLLADEADDIPMPWCDWCRCYHSDKAEHIKRTLTLEEFNTLCREKQS